MGEFVEVAPRLWDHKVAGVAAFLLSAAGLFYAWGFMWGFPLFLALLLGLLVGTTAFYRNIHILEKFITKMQAKAAEATRSPSKQG